jgi:hypothetical protein
MFQHFPIPSHEIVQPSPDVLCPVSIPSRAAMPDIVSSRQYYAIVVRIASRHVHSVPRGAARGGGTGASPPPSTARAGALEARVAGNETVNATGTPTDRGRNGGYDDDVDEEYVAGVLSRRNATFSELVSVGPSTYARTIPSTSPWLGTHGHRVVCVAKNCKKEWSAFGG